MTNERPQTDYVIRGPMRGLEQNCMGRGQTHNTQRTHRQTLQLLDQLGPEGRVAENQTKFPPFTSDSADSLSIISKTTTY